MFGNQSISLVPLSVHHWKLLLIRDLNLHPDVYFVSPLLKLIIQITELVIDRQAHYGGKKV